MTMGEKLATLRKRKGITQECLSEILNVSRQSVSRWELNAAFPETEKLIKLSRLLECSIDFLLNATGSSPPTTAFSSFGNADTFSWPPYPRKSRIFGPWE